MSYPIVLCVVAVEALNVALLWTGVRVSISRMFRPLIAGFGPAGAWGAWVLVLVLHGPAWMMALAGLVFALSAVAMGIAIHLATVEGEDGPDAGGGGAPTVGPEGPTGGEHDDPPWWPEFERHLAAYAARPDRERQRERRERRVRI